MKLSNHSKGVDLVAGSEKILRVHHRNMVHARYLQNSLNNLDAVCKRNLNRVQQEIYNVYYSEYLPLIESKKRINDVVQKPPVRRGTKRFDFVGDGRVKQKCTLPEVSSTTSSFRSISTMSTISGFSEDIVLPSIFERLGKRTTHNNTEFKEPTFIPLSALLKLSKDERSKFIGKWKEDFERLCPSVLSRSEGNGSPNIDSDRLQTIKSAIALSSQPPPDSDLFKKNRKLRRSFLVNLRKQSMAVWNDNVLKGIKERRSSNAKQTPSVSSRRNSSAKSVRTLLKPSIVRNTECSNEDIENMSRCSSKSSLTAFTENVKNTFHDILNSPDDDMYYSATPDLFSEIDEEPSSFEDSEYDDSSYTSGTGSSYWEYSDEDQSFTDDER